MPGAARHAAVPLEIRIRSAIAVAALGAALIGLLGVDGGLLWIVAGVWTARAIAGSDLGVAWGMACAAAALRWGTTGLSDVAVATRLTGPTLVAGAVPIRAAMAVAVAGALIDEARVAGLRAATRVEQASALLALVALVALFAGDGPSAALDESLGWWAGSAAAAGLVVLSCARPAQKLPKLVPLVLAVAGVVGGLVLT